VADTPAAAAKRFGEVAAVLAAGSWLTSVHTDIGKYGKQVAQGRGGVMHPWSKKSHSKRTARLGGKYDANPERVQIKPTPAGLWAIREKGAKPHVEPRTSKRRKTGRTVLKFGDNYAAHVNQGGAHARPAWEDVRLDVTTKAPEIIDKAVIKTLAKTFTGG
jgi:hypothetical protein